jgi:hypothetical protein
MSYLTWSGFRDLADRLVGRRRQGGCLLYVVGGLLGRVLGGGAAEEVKKASAALGVLCLASGGVLHSDSLLVSPQLFGQSARVTAALLGEDLFFVCRHRTFGAETAEPGWLQAVPRLCRGLTGESVGGP